MEPEQGLTEHRGAEHPHHEHLAKIEIHVNTKPVHMIGHRHTGLEIKEAAIAQGVKIKLDFLLFLIRHNQPNDPIGDDQTVTTTNESDFHAIDDDDNS